LSVGSVSRVFQEKLQLQRLLLLLSDTKRLSVCLSGDDGTTAAQAAQELRGRVFSDDRSPFPSAIPLAAAAALRLIRPRSLSSTLLFHPPQLMPKTDQ